MTYFVAPGFNPGARMPGSGVQNPVPNPNAIGMTGFVAPGFNPGAGIPCPKSSSQSKCHRHDRLCDPGFQPGILTHQANRNSLKIDL